MAHDRGLKRLTFPERYPPTAKTRYEPSTAIKQFSSGRNYVLGLADDGKVWYWARSEALQIKFLHVDLTETNVSRVVAGMFNRNRDPTKSALRLLQDGITLLFISLVRVSSIGIQKNHVWKKVRTP